MSFSTLANENGVTMVNGECAVYTGVMPQLTLYGMYAFCRQFHIVYQPNMEDDFRIKLYINSKNDLLYSLWTTDEIKKKYLPVEDMTYPPVNKDSFRNEADFLSSMLDYLNSLKLKPNQRFLFTKIASTIEEDLQAVKDINEREEMKRAEYQKAEEADRIQRENYYEAESKQHHPCIFALCCFGVFFLAIILMLNADTLDFGAFLMFVFFILSVIGPFIIAWMSNDNVKIRHEHGVYDRKRDIKDNAATIGCIGIGVKNLHTTGKKLHSTLYGDGKHHKV